MCKQTSYRDWIPKTLESSSEMNNGYLVDMLTLNKEEEENKKTVNHPFIASCMCICLTGKSWFAIMPNGTYTDVWECSE